MTEPKRYRADVCEYLDGEGACSKMPVAEPCPCPDDKCILPVREEKEQCVWVCVYKESGLAYPRHQLDRPQWNEPEQKDQGYWEWRKFRLVPCGKQEPPEHRYGPSSIPTHLRDFQDKEPREGKELPPTQEDMTKMRAKFDKAAAHYPEEMPWVEYELNMIEGCLYYYRGDKPIRLDTAEWQPCGYRFEDGSYDRLPYKPRTKSNIFLSYAANGNAIKKIEWAVAVCFPKETA